MQLCVCTCAPVVRFSFSIYNNHILNSTCIQIAATLSFFPPIFLNSFPWCWHAAVCSSCFPLVVRVFDVKMPRAGGKRSKRRRRTRRCCDWHCNRSLRVFVPPQQEAWVHKRARVTREPPGPSGASDKTMLPSVSDFVNERGEGVAPSPIFQVTLHVNLFIHPVCLFIAA